MFATKTSIQWTHLLDDFGVPNEIPLDTKGGEAVLFDADNERLDLVADYEQAKVGRVRQFGTLIDFSDTPGLVHGPVPMLGQHTREILGWLGYGDDDMEKLKADKVVYWPDDEYRWPS